MQFVKKVEEGCEEGKYTSQLAPPLSTISLDSLEHTLPELFLCGHKPMFMNCTSTKCELLCS